MQSSTLYFYLNKKEYAIFILEYAGFIIKDARLIHADGRFICKFRTFIHEDDRFINKSGTFINESARFYYKVGIFLYFFAKKHNIFPTWAIFNVHFVSQICGDGIRQLLFVQEKDYTRHCEAGSNLYRCTPNSVLISAHTRLLPLPQ